MAVQIGDGKLGALVNAGAPGVRSGTDRSTRMTDTLDCYYLVVVDDAGVAHHIAISKGEGSGKRLGGLEAAAHEAKLQFMRCIPAPAFSSQRD